MAGKKKPKARKSKSRPIRRPKRQTIELGVLEAIIERAKSSPLSEDDHEKLKAAIETLAFITRELESKRVSITRLKKLLFGASTEKTSQVFGEAAGSGVGRGPGGDRKNNGEKRKGHGKNGAAAYTGAEKVKVPHETLKPGDPCPECPKGKLYPLAEPAMLVRVTGMAPLQAKVYECERLRCNLCGVVLTAKSPEGVGTVKYDETVAAMIGLLKYGTGMPFNRLERLQRGMGIPLPASTQWDLVNVAADQVAAVYAEIIRQAAQGDVLHNDDTTARILDLMGLRREQALAKGELDDEDRTGIFTSGILSVTEAHKLAVFFTGTQHAGENLTDLLAKRNEDLGAPIQMCDALSRNLPSEIQTIVANCVAHARRKFVDEANNFPDEVKHVLEELGKVYKNDAVTKKQQMSKDERLAYHQDHSGPVMKELKTWLKALTKERKVEPNSGLGDAIGYMLDHWDKLTLFLTVPGAPLDNNV
ncbi:MAG: transposase, partial [bacterium]